MQFFIVTDMEGKPIENAYNQILLYKSLEDAKEEANKYPGRKVRTTYSPRKKTRKKV